MLAIVISTSVHTGHQRQLAAVSTTQQVAGLRHAIRWHRGKTWRLQDQAGVSRTPTRHVERHTTSVPFLHWVNNLWLRRQKAASRLLRSHSGSVPNLICRVFGANCSMALRVARRESGFCTCAVNGQYLGIFQMGYHERQRFATIGYSTAWQQIVAAHNYFMVSGWSPWSQTAY